MPTLLVAQKSDLDRASHSTVYEGDSALMAPLLDLLRSDYDGVIVSRDELCNEVVKEIGTIETDEGEYLLIHNTSGIGHSCKGVMNLLIFKENQFAGFYRSDLDWSFWIKDNKLLAISPFSDSAVDEFEFSSTLPDTLMTFPALKLKPASNYKRDE